MSSCECCYVAAQVRAMVSRKSVSDLYHVIMGEHAAGGCVCTTDTEEGDRARAGQFWDEEKQMDTRLEER